jgi:hypothetical protein
VIVGHQDGRNATVQANQRPSLSALHRRVTWIATVELPFPIRLKDGSVLNVH